jgi:carbamoyl-phosphate synthase large subunit
MYRSSLRQYRAATRLSTVGGQAGARVRPVPTFTSINGRALSTSSALRAVAAPAVGNYTPSTDGPTLNSPSELARKISAQVLPRLPPVDVKKVLVVGSGGLSIGQAGEFDYSGEPSLIRPTCPSLEELKLFMRKLYRIPSHQGSQRVQYRHHPDQPQHRDNPDLASPGCKYSMCQAAFVQKPTDIPLDCYLVTNATQDTIFFLPVTADYVAYVLEKERPDGILLTFGGQSALNVGIQLDKMGILERLGVQVLGTPIRTLEVSEDRDLFVQALNGELLGPLSMNRCALANCGSDSLPIARDRHPRRTLGRCIIDPGCSRCRCSNRLPHHHSISLFAWRSGIRFRPR